MSEIDVSKCEDFEKATCFDNDFDEIEFDYCKLFDEPCEDARNNNRCTYKLKQQIQQLKQENKRISILELSCKHKDEKFTKYRKLAEQKLERIKEIIIKRQKEHYCYCDECSPFKDILQIIEEK